MAWAKRKGNLNTYEQIVSVIEPTETASNSTQKLHKTEQLKWTCLGFHSALCLEAWGAFSRCCFV